MNYPLISEYIESIRYAEDNFATLTNLRPVLDDDGNPIMSSGNFAVVFKMKDKITGKRHAVKCFLREQKGREEAYRMISEELEYVSSTYLTPIKYLKGELFVNTSTSTETEFPVLTMDWVEGITLDKYIRKHINDKYELSMLAYQFSRLAMWLMPQPFAHGDLKPDNILVRHDGTLVLVDYDGMFVPAMKGQKARELGSPDFRHPQRTEKDFDEHIDDFSLASILLSLKAISIKPLLLEKYGATDRLLFSVKDYGNMSESVVMSAMKSLMQDTEFAMLQTLFMNLVVQKNLSQESLRVFNLSKPDKSEYMEEEFIRKVSYKNGQNAWVDNFGVEYSADMKKLIKAPKDITDYTIRNGTKIIDDSAFENCSELKNIVLPNSVNEIGENAFSGCVELANIVIPNSVTRIDSYAFAGSGLKNIVIPNGVKYIGAQAFYGCSRLTNLVFSNGVTETGWYGVFEECVKLKNIVIPNSVRKISENAFSGCVGLTNIVIPNSVTEIGEGAFCGCERLANLVIPKSVRNIGYGAFGGCSSLKSIVVDADNSDYDSRDNCNAIIQSSSNMLVAGCINSFIPNDVNEIGDNAFSWCTGLTKIVIPNSVTRISAYAFSGCTELTNIVIPNTVTKIDVGAFSDCTGLRNIVLPNSINSISSYAFARCTGLTNIVFPNSVTSIYNDAFSNCIELTNIVIPNSVKIIDDRAFYQCVGLTNIVILNGSMKIGYLAFSGCDGLRNIVIPYGTRNKFERIFGRNLHDKLIEQ